MLTTVKVEQELGIGERTLQRLMRGDPSLRPATRIGATYVWTTAEVARVRKALAARREKKERAAS